MEGKLNAQLSRLLSRAPSSPYWRYAEISLLGEADSAGKTVKDYVFDECFKAYSLDKLSLLLQEYLLLCERSIAVHQELFEGNVSNLQLLNEDEQVINRMVENGDIETE